MRDFRKLKVWEQAHSLALDVYKETRNFPSSEIYGLTSQMRRCATSIPSNIAEGCGRAGGADFQRFLVIAMGSASELEYQLLLAKDLNLLKKEPWESLSQQTVSVKRMLGTLINKLKAEG